MDVINGNRKVEYKGENGDTITLDTHTYTEIVRACMIKYGNKSNEEANEILKQSNYFNENFPPKTFNQAALLDSEIIYHASMMILYGDNYWNRPDYKSVDINDYYLWEDQFIEENNLNEDYIDYD